MTNIPSIVIVVGSEIPNGVVANTCALLAVTIGQRHPELVGEDLSDASGVTHAGLCGVPIPILAVDSGRLLQLAAPREGIEVIGFTQTAAGARTYPDYRTELLDTPSDDLSYLGIALLGARKALRSLTGDLPLYR